MVTIHLRGQASEYSCQISIKSGKYSLAQVREMANDMFVEAKSAYEKSALPAAPNTKRAEEILMELTDCIWQSNV